jgi:hypothetical protein
MFVVVSYQSRPDFVKFPKYQNSTAVGVGHLKEVSQDNAKYGRDQRGCRENRHGAIVFYAIPKDAAGEICRGVADLQERIEIIESKAGSPGTGISRAAGREHKTRFMRWLRKPRDSEAKNLMNEFQRREAKAMSIGSNADGRVRCTGRDRQRHRAAGAEAVAGPQSCDDG